MIRYFLSSTLIRNRSIIRRRIEYKFFRFLTMTNLMIRGTTSKIEDIIKEKIEKKKFLNQQKRDAKEYNCKNMYKNYQIVKILINELKEEKIVKEIFEMI